MSRNSDPTIRTLARLTMSLGAKMGAISARRQAPGYVRPQRTSAAAGERHVWLLPATSGDSPGLIHTEEIREVGICPFPGVRKETSSRDH